MTLVDLVTYFRNDGNYADFFERHNINPDAEIIDIYMVKPFRVSSSIQFFEIEQTFGAEDFRHDGVRYSNLFDLHYMLDLIKESTDEKNRHIDDTATAEILLTHAINTNQ